MSEKTSSAAKSRQQDPVAGEAGHEVAALEQAASGESVLPGAVETRSARKAAKRLLAWIDRAVAGLFPFMLRVGGVIGVGMLFGAGLWWLVHPEARGDLLANRAPAELRLAQLSWGLIAAGITVLGWLLVALLRRRGMAPRLSSYVRPATLAPLALIVPLVGTLSAPKIETQRSHAALLLCVLAGSLLAVAIHQWPRSTRAAGKRLVKASTARALGASAVALLALGYGAFFGFLSVRNHHALVTRVFDLGIYDNIFYQSIHGNPLGCSFIKAGYHGSAHFDPLLVVLSPLYLLYPRAEFLLVFQSVWLGLGAIPVYLLATQKVESRLFGVALAAVWTLYPALHGANMYDFHSLTLVAPSLVWLLYFLETQRLRLYWIPFVVLLLTREDVSLLLCFVGLYAILRRHPQALFRTGWVSILASLVYFAVVKLFFMTSPDIFMTGKQSYSFAYYYAELIPHGGGVRELLISLVTNPGFVLLHAFGEEKVKLLLVLFAPLLFLPFLAPRGKVMMVYGLLFCLLASRKPVYSPHFQYTCVLFPIAFALVPGGVKRLEEILDRSGRQRAFARAAAGGILLAGALASWKFGGIVENASFRGGFAVVSRDYSEAKRKRYAWVEARAASIPKTASVAVTDRLGAHVSNRMAAYMFRDGHKEADYLFLDEREIGRKDRARYRRLKREEYEEIARRQRLVLLRRRGQAAPATPDR